MDGAKNLRSVDLQDFFGIDKFLETHQWVSDEHVLDLRKTESIVDRLILENAKNRIGYADYNGHSDPSVEGF